MKLLTRTTRSYVGLSLVLFLILGCIMYYTITSVVREEVTDKLKVNVERIFWQIEAGKPPRSIPPILEIRKMSKKAPETSWVKDTLVFDPIEEDNELFREVGAVRKIKYTKYHVVVRQVILEPHDYVQTIAFPLLLVLIVLVVGGVITSRSLSRKLWEPFYRDLDQLSSFSIQNGEALEVTKSGIDEFEELNAVLQSLTAKLISDYKSLKQFSENASHEMQTPLAIISSKLEEAIQTEGLTEDQSVAIGAAMAAANRLSKLNQQLVWMTKIDNRQYDKTETLNIADILSEQIWQYKDQMDGKKIELETDIAPKIIKQGNAALVASLCTNLISNAIKHNQEEGGSIQIRLDEHSLSISNTGPVYDTEASTLFDRFNIGNPHSESMGLGLSIAQSICNFHNWGIDYAQEDNRHLFTVQF